MCRYLSLALCVVWGARPADARTWKLRKGSIPILRACVTAERACRQNTAVLGADAERATMEGGVPVMTGQVNVSGSRGHRRCCP